MTFPARSWYQSKGMLHITKGPEFDHRNVSLGPVSSLHDRACELYYSLAGGRVDYGAQHSSRHRHDRYGRTFPVGLYPQWSVKHPLHFLGHSVASRISDMQYTRPPATLDNLTCELYREDPLSSNCSTCCRKVILEKIVTRT